MRAKVTRVQVTSPLTRDTIDSSCKYDFSCGKSRKRRRKEKKRKRERKGKRKRKKRINALHTHAS